MQTVDKIRYAFERDMMRRMPRNAGIIVLCVECEQDFNRKVPNQVVCDDCRGGRVRKQTKERVRRHRARKVEPEYEFTEVDKHNLVTALIRACVYDMLKKYAGQEPACQICTEIWLLDCAEPYMAACGEYINIDSVLEKVDDQK